MLDCAGDTVFCLLRESSAEGWWIGLETVSKRETMLYGDDLLAVSEWCAKYGAEKEG
jgi:hypothetical protein